MVKALALHATKNTGGKVDATGAFVPEAVAFTRRYACHREGFDNALAEPARRKSVESIIGRYRDLDAVAIFCHGLRRSLQTGHTVMTSGTLAGAIADATTTSCVVVLYACSTGARDDGFAADVADALHSLGKVGHVDAHTNAAHTTRNPNVKRFAFGSPAGEWLVEPGAPEWKRWRTALQGDMRFRFPFMTRDEILTELRA